MTTIVEVIARDVRFPTSQEHHGSDAMHPDPDYSAVYIVIKTDGDGGLTGYGLTFTIGRGNEIVLAAVNTYKRMMLGRKLEDIFMDFAAFWRELAYESQLSWLGPQKGAIHLALASVINALWDLWGRMEGKPVWKLLADMSPEQLVSTVDFQYLTDVLTKEEAIEMLKKNAATRQERMQYLQAHGYPAYTTSAGWLGYTDEQIRALLKKYSTLGWSRFKMKIGADIQDDIKRAAIIREEIGADGFLAMDANQRWDVDESINWMKQLAQFKPVWIEEPTSPDDILGHAAIAKALAPDGIGVATGEQCQNRVMFKQFLQANAMQYCQVDSCRLGGLNEVLAVLLLAAKFEVPVCPHGGGVGLCEYTQHIAAIDYICISGQLDKRVLEYADHLHEHFVDPVVTEKGAYKLPQAPGYSAEMKLNSVDTYEFPNGAVWQKLISEGKVKI